MEFEFEFLFQPGLKFTFELECEFDLDFEFKSEFVVEVARSSWSSNSLLLQFISLTCSCQTPKKYRDARTKQPLNSIFTSIWFESYLSGTQNWSQNDPLGGPNGAPLGIAEQIN